MCLETIVREYKHPKAGFGWKLVRDGGRGVFKPLHQNYDRGFRVGEWLVAKETVLAVDGASRDIYTSGFHIYLNKLDAKRVLRNAYTGCEDVVHLVRVAYRGGHTVGKNMKLNDLGNTIIAREMKILPLRKRAAK